tara:strand:- start:55 stop:498 length:444 start_codon:yes stop_codon:yes gene_type:complete
MNNDQELMDYKLIDAKHRAVLPKLFKSVCLEKKQDAEKRLSEYLLINKDESNSAFVTLSCWADMCRTRIKSLIYLHNGDTRNVIKYYRKNYTAGCKFIEHLGERVEQNEGSEGEYVAVCGELKDELDMYRYHCEILQGEYTENIILI